MLTRVLLLAALVFARPLAAAAEAPPSTPPAPAERELALVVVENLDESASAITAFDRLEIAFREVIRERRWSVKLTAERFAANTPDHPTELRIFNKGIQQETPNELTYRAWMTLVDRGTKHDFGIVKFRYYPRFGERPDATLEAIYLGAARAAADKIQPFLFPQPAAAKP